MAFPRLILLAGLLLAAYPASAQDSQRDPLNRQLPDWLTVGVQSLFRLEATYNLGFVEERDDGYLLSRQRLQVGVRANRHLRFFAEGQDSRSFGAEGLAGQPNFRDDFDLRRAYVVIGDEKKGWWDVKAGRQELAFGYERLIGINQWSMTPRTFDAVKLGIHHGNNRVDFLAASVVAVDPDDFDRHRDGDNVHAVYASLGDVLPKLTFEPHLIWRVRPQVVDERGFSADADVFTYGARLATKLKSPLSLQMELDGQAGTFGRDDLRSFMGLWGVGYKLDDAPGQPTLVAEYTFAKGDSEAGDGRIGTFDQIYVRAHRIWGIADQVGGRNSKIFLTGAHFRPGRDWQLNIDHSLFWLANRNDGLYRHNGRLVIPRVPGGAESAFVGNEIDVQLTYRPSEFWTFGTGVAHLFPGGFLKAHSGGSSFTYPYVFLQFAL